MTWTSLFVRLEAKKGKESDVAKLLNDALVLVKQESPTGMWVTLRLSPSSFGIVESFPGNAGKRAHLHEKLAAVLATNTATLFAGPPVVEEAGFLAVQSAPKPGQPPIVISFRNRTRLRQREGQPDVLRRLL